MIRIPGANRKIYIVVSLYYSKWEKSRRVKKMEKKQKKTQSKEIRMNVNYVNFVQKVKNEKLENVNREKLEEIYSQEMGLKPSNIERVSKRVNRKELREILSQELKNREMSFSEFEKINSKIVSSLKEKKNNYVSVKI